MPLARTFMFHVSRLECLDFQVVCFGLQCWMTALVFRCPDWLTRRRLTDSTTSTQRSFARPGTQRQMLFSFPFILAGFKSVQSISCVHVLPLWCVIVEAAPQWNWAICLWRAGDTCVGKVLNHPDAALTLRRPGSGLSCNQSIIYLCDIII